MNKVQVVVSFELPYHEIKWCGQLLCHKKPCMNDTALCHDTTNNVIKSLYIIHMQPSQIHKTLTLKPHFTAFSD